MVRIHAARNHAGWIAAKAAAPAMKTAGMKSSFFREENFFREFEFFMIIRLRLWGEIYTIDLINYNKRVRIQQVGAYNRMILSKACDLLGIKPGDQKDEIKRKYRQMMLEIHPDALLEGNKSYIDVREINEAYELLVKKDGWKQLKKLPEKQPTRKKQKETAIWKAPVNSNAYVERTVFQYVEDSYGNVLGEYAASVGKYYWDFDLEDATLFLKSMFHTANRLIEQAEEEKGSFVSETEKLHLQKELLFLLAGQFTDLETGLKVLSKEQKEDTEGKIMYRFGASLEWAPSPGACKISQMKAGDHLYPLQLKDHRLYIGTSTGIRLGYLSFPDDRMYYVLLPMFENRELQLKIIAGERYRARRNGKEYFTVDLWVRKAEVGNGVQTDSNEKIRNVLNMV